MLTFRAVSRSLRRRANRWKRQHLPFTLRWYNLLYQFVGLYQLIVLRFPIDAAPVFIETNPTIQVVNFKPFDWLIRFFHFFNCGTCQFEGSHAFGKMNVWKLDVSPLYEFLKIMKTTCQFYSRTPAPSLYLLFAIAGNAEAGDGRSFVKIKNKKIQASSSVAKII